MGYEKIVIAARGEKLTVNAALSLNAFYYLITPFIAGDSIGVDITLATKTGIDASVRKQIA